METILALLKNLGIEHATLRHIHLVDTFLESRERDAKVLLNQLGEWDANDLKITQTWLDKIYTND